MRRKSFLALFAPTILAALSPTPIFAEATQTVVSDSKTSAPPSPDTTPPGSDDSSPAAPTALPPDADPTAPGLTPEQYRAAVKTHIAFVKAKVAAAQARAAAIRQKAAAARAQTEAIRQKLAGTAQASPDSDSTTPGSTGQSAPASDATPPASNGPSSAARTALPPDADPTAPGLTPEQRRAASEAHRAFVAAQIAANKARLAAAKEKRDALLERVKQIHDNDPTTFAPDHENLNKASYQAMFQMDAFTALNKALAIQGRTARPNLKPSESALFQAIHSGQGSKYSFADAALIASGVDDPTKRKQYLAKIGQIVAEAKKRTDKQKAIVEKAGAIIDYLFAFPMKNGYDDDTFSLAQVLDTGHFNCTSSVVMFVAVAHGVGLDVGAVVEPEHMVARVPGYDVQTTSGRIFATNFRLKDIQDQKYNSEQMNKFDPDHPYHEVGDNGVLLELYQTIANRAHDKKQPDQAAIGALKEVFLDPTMPCAGHDLKVFLLEWFNAATTGKDVTTATAIAKLYREMSRDPAPANDMDQCVVTLKKQLAKH